MTEAVFVVGSGLGAADGVGVGVTGSPGFPGRVNMRWRGLLMRVSEGIPHLFEPIA